MELPQVRKRNRQPTLKQIKTLQNIQMGMNVSKAMREAGYSPKVAHMSTKFFKKRGVQLALETVLHTLQRKGFDDEFYTDKIVEFATATKLDHSPTEPDREVPDYSTQIQGVKMYEKIKEKVQEQGHGKVKRKVTFEEFVE